MTGQDRGDRYAAGWAEGMRQARYLTLQASDVPDAVQRIEALLEQDHAARAARAAANRKRKGDRR